VGGRFISGFYIVFLVECKLVCSTVVCYFSLTIFQIGGMESSWCLHDLLWLFERVVASKPECILYGIFLFEGNGRTVLGF
jgi:hypothetical protein